MHYGLVAHDDSDAASSAPMRQFKRLKSQHENATALPPPANKRGGKRAASPGKGHHDGRSVPAHAEKITDESPSSAVASVDTAPASEAEKPPASDAVVALGDGATPPEAADGLAQEETPSAAQARSSTPAVEEESRRGESTATDARVEAQECRCDKAFTSRCGVHHWMHVVVELAGEVVTYALTLRYGLNLLGLLWQPLLPSQKAQTQELKPNGGKQVHGRVHGLLRDLRVVLVGAGEHHVNLPEHQVSEACGRQGLQEEGRSCSQ